MNALNFSLLQTQPLLVTITNPIMLTTMLEMAPLNLDLEADRQTAVHQGVPKQIFLFGHCLMHTL